MTTAVAYRTLQVGTWYRLKDGRPALALAKGPMGTWTVGLLDSSRPIDIRPDQVEAPWPVRLTVGRKRRRMDALSARFMATWGAKG